MADKKAGANGKRANSTKSTKSTNGDRLQYFMQCCLLVRLTKYFHEFHEESYKKASDCRVNPSDKPFTIAFIIKMFTWNSEMAKGCSAEESERMTRLKDHYFAHVESARTSTTEQIKRLLGLVPHPSIFHFWLRMLVPSVKSFSCRVEDPQIVFNSFYAFCENLHNRLRDSDNPNVMDPCFEEMKSALKTWKSRCKIDKLADISLDKALLPIVIRRSVLESHPLYMCKKSVARFQSVCRYIFTTKQFDGADCTKKLDEYISKYLKKVDRYFNTESKTPPNFLAALPQDVTNKFRNIFLASDQTPITISETDNDKCAVNSDNNVYVNAYAAGSSSSSGQQQQQQQKQSVPTSPTSSSSQAQSVSSSDSSAPVTPVTPEPMVTQTVAVSMAPEVSMAPVLQTQLAPATTSEQETQSAVQNLIMCDTNTSFANSDPTASYVASVIQSSEPLATVSAYDGDNLNTLSNILDDFVSNPPPDVNILQTGSILEEVCRGDGDQRVSPQQQHGQQLVVQKYAVNENELLHYENYVTVDNQQQQQRSELEQQEQLEQQQSAEFQAPIDVSDAESDDGQQLPPSPAKTSPVVTAATTVVVSPGAAAKFNSNRNAFDMFNQKIIKKAKSIEDLGIGAANGVNSSITSGDKCHSIATTSSSSSSSNDSGMKRDASGVLKVNDTTGVTAAVNTPISASRQLQESTGNDLPNKDGRRVSSGRWGVGIASKRCVRISDSKNKKAYSSSESSDSEEEEERKSKSSRKSKSKKREYSSANNNNNDDDNDNDNDNDNNDDADASADSDSGSSSSGSDSESNDNDSDNDNSGSGSCSSDQETAAGDRRKAVPAKRFTKRKPSPDSVSKSATTYAATTTTSAAGTDPVVDRENSEVTSKETEVETLSGSEDEVQVVTSDSEAEMGPTKAKRRMTSAEGGHAVFTADLVKLKKKVESDMNSKLDALREQLTSERMAQLLAMEQKINTYCEKLVTATALAAHENAVSAAADAANMPPPPPPACPPPRPASYTSMSNGCRKKMSDQPMTVANFLKFMLHLDPHPIPYKTKLFPVPDFDNTQEFSHLPAYLLISKDDPALQTQDLRIISEHEFRYLLRCGFEWDQESDTRLKKCLNLGPDQTDCIDVNFYVNDFIVKIYNKLSEAALQNNLNSLTEILIFRFLSHIKQISGGSFTQASARANFLKQKNETEMAKETMTDRLCCIACQSARVQYGWLDIDKRKINLKFCSACMNNCKEKCLELCQQDTELQRAGIKIKTENDMRKYFMVVSYAGKKLSIKKGAKLVKSGASAVMATPRREAEYPDIDPAIVDVDLEDNCAVTSASTSGSSSKKRPAGTNKPKTSRPEPKPSTSSSPDKDTTRKAMEAIMASIPTSALATSDDCKKMVEAMMGTMNVKEIIKRVDKANEKKISDMKKELEQSSIALALQKKQYERQKKRVSSATLSPECYEPEAKKHKKSKSSSSKHSSSDSKGKGGSKSKSKSAKKHKSVEFVQDVDDDDDC